jgi:hypothetical protein
MNEVSYFTIRGLHYSKLALETGDPTLRAAYEAIAADMLAKRMPQHHPVPEAPGQIEPAAIDPIARITRNLMQPFGSCSRVG